MTDVKTNRESGGRRRFLSYFGVLLAMIAAPSALPASKKNNKDDGYFMMNGWVLKKKDLHDL